MSSRTSRIIPSKDDMRRARRLARKATSMMKRNPVFRVVLLWITGFMILESFFFTEVIKGHNYLEIFPKELIFPSLMHATTALIIAMVVYVLRKPSTLGSKMVTSVVLALFMVGYEDRLVTFLGLLRSIIPLLPQTGDDIPLISLVFMGILLFIAVRIGRWMERYQINIHHLRDGNLVASVLVLVSFVFAGQAIVIAKLLPSWSRQSNVTATMLEKSGDEPADSSRPDIFYIVLDRYASASTLSEQFGFDNSKFTNFLRENGFTVNDQAVTNYPYTAMSIASTMNADYTKNQVDAFKDDPTQTAVLYHNLIRQSSVAKALKSSGYQYHLVGSDYATTNKAPLAVKEYTSAYVIKRKNGQQIKHLRGVEAFQFLKSPYLRFARIVSLSWWPVRFSETEGVNFIRNQLLSLQDLTTTNDSGGRFVFAHILVPHDPFYFNADGSLSSYPAPDNNNKPVKQKYIEQVQFINTYMEQLVENIKQQSGGKAVVIFNSDEGPYPQLMNSTFLEPTGYESEVVGNIATNEDMREWSDDWLKMKFGILQAVSIPGATTDDLTALSSVNLFRIVLNRYAGYNLPYLPHCQFGLVRGKWFGFNYADVTSRFSEEPPSVCGELENLPSL